MKKIRLLPTTVYFMGLLLIVSGCGLTVNVDDPVGAARVVRDATQRDRSEETTKAEAEELEPEKREFSEIVPAFANLRTRFDDRIGFEEYYLIESDSTFTTVAGVIRRQFYNPDDRSPFEIYRYYKQTIQEMGGEIIFQTRDPQSIEIDEKGFTYYFNKERVNRGSATQVYDFHRFPRSISEYLVGKITEDGKTVYYAVAAGRGSGWTDYSGVRFEVVTVVVE